MSATRFPLTWPDGVRVTAVMLRRKVAFPFSLCRAALCGALLLSGVSRSSAQTLTQPADRKHTTLTGRVMVGYQAWFRAVGDGTPLGWAHYKTDSGKFETGFLNMDYWPDVSELKSPDPVKSPGLRNPKYPVDTFTLPNGSIPDVYSSSDPEAIEMHFNWMETYGITGVFVQRFAEVLKNEWKESMDRALIKALDEAARTGRSVAIMYDLSGLAFGKMQDVIDDWTELVTKFGASGGGDVRQHPAYQWHRGKPVVAVYGIGFKEDRDYTIAETKVLLERLKAGGNTVMAAVSDDWFAQTGREDAPVPGEVKHGVKEPKLPVMLTEAKVDIISPWTIGRYKDLGEARWHIEKRKPERDWCVKNKIDYMGVVFPGFSDVNLKWNRKGEDNTKNRADREDGRFLWEQYRWLAEDGCTMVYQAMFDEMDEGTQIFKVLANPPLSPKPELKKPDLQLQSYGTLPTDYYLRLVGQATSHFPKGTNFPPRVPFDAFPNVSTDLRAGDKERYQFAQRSYETNKAMDLISAELVLDPPTEKNKWLSVAAQPAPNSYVVVAGQGWNPRLTNNQTNPDAWVCWFITPKVSGRPWVWIRYPGDRLSEHANEAKLVITQQTEPKDKEFPVNLRLNTMRFIPIAQINAPADYMVRITLRHSAPPAMSGALMLFEAKLGPPPDTTPINVRIMRN